MFNKDLSDSNILRHVGLRLNEPSGRVRRAEMGVASDLFGWAGENGRDVSDKSGSLCRKS